MNKKEWIKKLRPYWKEYRKIESEFFKKVDKLEERMRKELNNENLEFAYAKFGGGIDLYFGIGFERIKKSKLSLIHDLDLEE